MKRILFYLSLMIMVAFMTWGAFAQESNLNSRFATIDVSKITAVSSEVNVLDGITATTDNLNMLTGGLVTINVTSGEGAYSNSILSEWTPSEDMSSHGSNGIYSISNAVKDVQNAYALRGRMDLRDATGTVGVGQLHAVDALINLNETQNYTVVDNVSVFGAAIHGGTSGTWTSTGSTQSLNLFYGAWGSTANQEYDITTNMMLLLTHAGTNVDYGVNIENSADMDAGILLNNHASNSPATMDIGIEMISAASKMVNGINMSAADFTGADIVLDEGETISNSIDGLVAISGRLSIGGAELNDMFSYQMAGDVFNLDPATHLLLAWTTPATTEQDLSPHNHDMTYVGTMTTDDQIPVGLVWMLDMDGTDDAGTIADHNDFFFDDASSANGFTVNAWVLVTAAADTQMVLSQYDLTDGNTAEVWAFFIDEDEYLSMMLIDDSAPAHESMQSDAALVTATKYMITAVYDGAGGASASAGITLYVDGVAVAATATDSGSYTGMENLTTLVRVGASENGDGDADNLWTGDLGKVSQSVTQFTADQVWELYLRTRGYYNQ